MKARKLGESTKALKAIIKAVYISAGICIPIALILLGLAIFGGFPNPDTLTLAANILAGANLIFVLLVTGTLGIRVIRWTRKAKSKANGESSAWMNRIFFKSIVMILTDLAFIMTLAVQFGFNNSSSTNLSEAFYSALDLFNSRCSLTDLADKYYLYSEQNRNSTDPLLLDAVHLLLLGGIYASIWLLSRLCARLGRRQGGGQTQILHKLCASSGDRWNEIGADEELEHGKVARWHYVQVIIVDGQARSQKHYKGGYTRHCRQHRISWIVKIFVRYGIKLRDHNGMFWLVFSRVLFGEVSNLTDS